MNAFAQYKIDITRRPSNDIGSLSPLETDVLCGKGQNFDQHPGNVIFRKLVQSNKQLYDSCPDSEKHIVGQTIIDTLEEQTPPVRFFEKKSYANGSRWVIIPRAKAVRKTERALREYGRSQDLGRHFEKQSRTAKRNWADDMVNTKRVKTQDTDEEPSNDEAWEWLLTNLKPLLPFSERDPKPNIIKSSSSRKTSEISCRKESNKTENAETVIPKIPKTNISLPARSLVRIVSNETERDSSKEILKKKIDCDASVKSLDTIEDCYVLGAFEDNLPVSSSQSCVSAKFGEMVNDFDKKQEDWTPPGFIEIEFSSNEEKSPCTPANCKNDQEEVSIPNTTEFKKVLEKVRDNANNVTDEESSQKSYGSYKSTTIIDLF